ncbi:MAG: DUF4920 domain-containing protein [Pyrinomonadaceae bacterium]|nr:DUF4920 domain-containing protein [Pyrinomonadaceae bacterium]
MKFKSLIILAGLILAISATAFGQEKGMEGMEGGKKPTEADKTAAIPTDGWLKRGDAIGKSKKVSLSKALASPEKFAGKKVIIEGVVVRSCKMEGCWAEVAEKQGEKSVRVKMKGHAFFIPLQSAGATARVEGEFQVKTLSKAEVDHMIEEDGAKFDNRNTDGSVTEVSFEATGIELKRS